MSWAEVRQRAMDKQYCIGCRNNREDCVVMDESAQCVARGTARLCRRVRIRVNEEEARSHVFVRVPSCYHLEGYVHVYPGDPMCEAETLTVTALAAMPYDSYLLTDHWKELREAVLRRDNHTCCICGKFGGRMVVHHKTYERRGRESLDDLETLCEDCHSVIHDRAPIESEVCEV